MATTTVDFLSDSSNRRWEIAGILRPHDCVQLAGTPMYMVYAHGAKGDLCWSSMLVGPALRQLRYVSIPNNIRELCDDCFRECKSLRRVNFGSSSSLERIGDSCFEGSGVEEVSIPDSVRELCKGCFPTAKQVDEINTPKI